MSGDMPEIVLNEFGDLSRKARRELEAKGIDPDTAVIEYIAATGQIPVISEEEAAAAKAHAQVAAAEAARETTASVEEPAPALSEEVVVENALEASAVPPVSDALVSGETGPIEPLAVSPALDSSTLSAVDETLAAVSEHTGEISTEFDNLVTAEEVEPSKGPTWIESFRTSREAKKAATLLAKQEKAEAAATAAAAALVTAQAAEQAEAVRLEHEEADRIAEQEKMLAEQEAAAEAAAIKLAREAEEAELEAQALSVADQVALHETEVEIVEVSDDVVETEAQARPDSDASDADLTLESEIGEDEREEELEPQTISEATAAIAIAEAVAAAEAVVEAGEVNIEYGNLASAVPTTTGSIPAISNALILPSLPETTGSIAPVNPTGEIVITGSILIPSAVSQTGAPFDSIDTSEIDVIADDAEVAPTQGMSPVSAASAVSAYNVSNTVVTTPRGLNERLPFILSITAAGLAVGVVALFIAGYFLGMF
ncbi:chemotaxis protein histidine kinase CheA [Aurantimicrobium minutum]|uniref:hypothetical protein n=1 Tax=Aurantimicrobium minutum TaxID=708131 RepID=UPI002474EA6E|nr:hypothetical protein [Aurantimicrobium minutum]MDH6532871.1 chemotaxis protein histidine kinase CheA [Aurantimicrobium minutum]